MVDIVEISKIEVGLCVLISYCGDRDLLDKYHVEKFSLKEAVESTLKMIDLTESELQLRFFKVKSKSRVIGYLITSGNHLYSFGINISSRTKIILEEWWGKVVEILGETFTCLLFSNNTRAIMFLKKRGMRVVWKNNEKKELKEVLLTY